LPWLGALFGVTHQQLASVFGFVKTLITFGNLALPKQTKSSRQPKTCLTSFEPCVSP
jgi:hypothetical protein